MTLAKGVLDCSLPDYTEVSNQIDISDCGTEWYALSLSKPCLSYKLGWHPRSLNLPVL